MATEFLKGSARFEYTPPGGSPIVHRLGTPLSPLREFVPSRLKQRFDWWSVDKVNREIVTIEGSAEEVVCIIRIDNEPVELKAMLQTALEDGTQLDYYPETGAPAIPLQLVEIPGAAPDEIPLTQDRGRFGGGEYEVPVRLRRIDGGTLDAIYRPSS